MGGCVLMVLALFGFCVTVVDVNKLSLPLPSRH